MPSRFTKVFYSTASNSKHKVLFLIIMRVRAFNLSVCLWCLQKARAQNIFFRTKQHTKEHTTREKYAVEKITENK